jgi:hypothetical protein
LPVAEDFISNPIRRPGEAGWLNRDVLFGEGIERSATETSPT